MCVNYRFLEFIRQTIADVRKCRLNVKTACHRHVRMRALSWRHYSSCFFTVTSAAISMIRACAFADRSLSSSAIPTYFHSLFKQGRIIHCAGCTMGGGPRRQGPPINCRLLPRCVDVRWRLKKVVKFLGEEKCTPREKILGMRMRKDPHVGMPSKWLIRPCV